MIILDNEKRGHPGGGVPATNRGGEGVLLRPRVIGEALKKKTVFGKKSDLKTEGGG